MKKILGLILALCMACSLCVPAMASAEPDAFAPLSLAEADWTYDEANSAWTLTGVCYCLNPNAPAQQSMNIYVPSAYMDENGALTETVVNGYNAATAPIIYVVDMGGYDEAHSAAIGRVSGYLAAGYVVATPACRGKATTDDTGAYIGKGAACITDLKAGIRFLKYNDAVLAGNTELIVVTGTSAGGAMAELLACSGNNDFFDPYLAEIGAVMTCTDDVYAAQCYCGAANQEHTDQLYEWFYAGTASYVDGGDASNEMASGEMNDFQLALSEDLAASYIEYINSLALSDENGNALTLSGLREGSYYDYAMSILGKALAAYIQETCSVTVSGMSPYTYVDEEAAQAYIDELNADGEWVSIDYTYATATTGPSTIVTYADGVVCTIASLDDYTARCLPRNDECPSSDTVDMGSPANQIYGTADTNLVHFSTVIADLLAQKDYSGLDGWEAELADAYADAYNHGEAVYALNPLNFIENSDVAPYIRIRAGTADDRICPLVSMNVALVIGSYSDSVVNFALAWNQPHGEAETDPAELTAWIERICKFEAPKTDEQIASLLNLDNMEYTWTLSGSEDTAYYVLSPIVEAANPEMAAYQGLSVAIPAYYVSGVNEDGSLTFDYDYEFVNPNGVVYTAATAPVIINTGAAGYSAGTTGKAGGGYVKYGYINVACGNRGKSLSTLDAAGEKYYCGDAPYCLVDQKACVRWLKYNIALGNICGDAERFISTGGSGGGAHSLMLAATGNNPDFYPYLEESGAVMRYTDENGNVVEISDALWGCCPYSAITNLQEANIAYEFESGLAKDDAILSRYSDFRQILSNAEAEQYMEYINSRGLTYDIDGDGVREELTIQHDEGTDTWSGTYIDMMELVAEEQLRWYVNNIPENEYEWAYSFEGESNGEAYLKGDYIATASGEMSGEMSGEPAAEEGYASQADASAKTGTGEDLTTWVDYTVAEDGTIDVDFDVADFMIYRGRSKTNPAFDDLDLGQAENQEFGDFDRDFKHWDRFVLNAFDACYDELEAAYNGDAAYATFADMYAAYKSDVESMEAGDRFGQNIVYLYNPLNYILDERTELPVWMHICHGSADTDSSVLISMNDGIAFDMMGVVGHFGWSWDDPHVAGDPVGTTMVGFIDSMVLAGN